MSDSQKVGIILIPSGPVLLRGVVNGGAASDPPYLMCSLPPRQNGNARGGPRHGTNVISPWTAVRCAAIGMALQFSSSCEKREQPDRIRTEQHVPVKSPGGGSDGDARNLPESPTSQREQAVAAAQRFNNTTSLSLEEVLKEAKAKNDTDYLSIWFSSRQSLSDEEWNSIVEALGDIGGDKAATHIFSLALSDIGSSRGVSLFKSTLDKTGSGNVRDSAIKHLALSSSPGSIVDVLLYLESNGYEEDLPTVYAFIGRSDLIRRPEADTFLKELFGNKGLEDRPELATELAKKIGEFKGNSKQPSLPVKDPDFLSGSSPETREAYLTSYYHTLLSQSGYIADMKATDLINSDIPEKFLLKDMLIISNLDVTTVGPSNAMNTFPSPATVMEREYIRNVFRLWIGIDSMAASKYIGTLPKDDVRQPLLVKEIIKYSRARGDTKSAEMWEASLTE